MSFISFDSEEIMRKVKQQVEKRIEEHPEEILDSRIGERINGKCAKCGPTMAIVLRDGHIQCEKCKSISSPDFSFDWR